MPKNSGLDQITKIWKIQSQCNKYEARQQLLHWGLAETTPWKNEEVGKVLGRRLSEHYDRALHDQLNFCRDIKGLEPIKSPQKLKRKRRKFLRDELWEDTVEVTWKPAPRGPAALMQLQDETECNPDEATLRQKLGRFGTVQKVTFNRNRDKAMVQFHDEDSALRAASVGLKKRHNMEVKLRDRSESIIADSEYSVSEKHDLFHEYGEEAIRHAQDRHHFQALDAVRQAQIRFQRARLSSWRGGASRPLLKREETVLNMSRKHLTDEVFERLMHVAIDNLPKDITKIDLSHNKLSNEAIRSLLRVFEWNQNILTVNISHQRPDDHTAPLFKDDLVEAKFDGGHDYYYPGRVLRVHLPEQLDGVATYDIEYDDGDMETQVPRNLIRKQFTVSQTLVEDLQAKLQRNKDMCPLGLSNGKISYSQLAKSDGWLPKNGHEVPTNIPFHPSRQNPQNPRCGVDWKHPDGSNRNNCIFIGGFGSKAHWVQVDLLRPRLVTGVVTQGRGDGDNWVTSYKILYKKSELQFAPYRAVKDMQGSEAIFSGNSDRSSKVLNKFVPFEARFVRIVPWTVYNSGLPPPESYLKFKKKHAHEKVGPDCLGEKNANQNENADEADQSEDGDMSNSGAAVKLQQPQNVGPIDRQKKKRPKVQIGQTVTQSTQRQPTSRKKAADNPAWHSPDGQNTEALAMMACLRFELLGVDDGKDLFQGEGLLDDDEGVEPLTCERCLAADAKLWCTNCEVNLCRECDKFTHSGSDKKRHSHVRVNANADRANHIKHTRFQRSVLKVEAQLKEFQKSYLGRKIASSSLLLQELTLHRIDQFKIWQAKNIRPRLGRLQRTAQSLSGARHVHKPGGVCGAPVKLHIPIEKQTHHNKAPKLSKAHLISSQTFVGQRIKLVVAACCACFIKTRDAKISPPEITKIKVEAETQKQMQPPS